MIDKQRQLAIFEQASLEALWDRFPESAREEVTQQYARLMARASVERIRALRTNQKKREMGNESSDG